MNDYSAYTAYVSNDPSHYGSTCTKKQAWRIALQSTKSLHAKFPGMTINVSSMIGTRHAIGPNDEVCREIDEFQTRIE